jgi:hypothetical protein
MPAHPAPALAACSHDLPPKAAPIRPATGHAPFDAMDEDLRGPVSRLLNRMRVEALTLRRDPTDPRSAILVRRGAGGPGDARPSLGAGRAPWRVVEAALSAGLVRDAQGAGRMIVLADRLAPDGRAASANHAPQPFAEAVEPEPAGQAPVAHALAHQPSGSASESPLAWLRRRRGADGEPLIDGAAFIAGERLRRDVTLAALLPSVTQNWARADGSASTAGFDPAGASDATVAARQRVSAAYAALGPRTCDFLIVVCAFLVPLQEAEKRRGWPARSGKLVLSLALGQLVQHYGVSESAVGPAAARRLRAWRPQARARSVAEANAVGG